MNIALLIASLRSGGAERVVSILSSYWAQQGHRVHILTLAGRDVPPFYSLDPDVNLVHLDLSRVAANPLQGLVSNVRRAAAIRRELYAIRPDAVISFMDTTNILAAFSMLGLGIPLIVADRNNPSARPMNGFWRPLRNLAYARADAVVVQTDRAASCFPPSVRARSVVIPNPVRRPSDNEVEPEIQLPQPTIVAMGRLTNQKGFDLLIEAFGQVADSHMDWHLAILGEGPERAALEKQSSVLGISDRVHLPGRVRNPDAVLRRAQLFVLSSRYEGFPNALLEAMACGLPVVSFDCPFGPAEIIQNGEDGILVNRTEAGALGDALENLVTDEALRRRLGVQATAVVGRFGLEKVTAMWAELLERVKLQVKN